MLPVVYVLEQKGLFTEYVRSRLRYQGSSGQDLQEWLKSIAKRSEREETYLTRAFKQFAILYVK
jgi:hypothetical protein